MFSNLSERLTETLKKIRGQARLTEENISDTLREIRLALLDADVALPVVKEFIAQVKTKALGTTLEKSLNPSQTFTKIVSDELTSVLGSEQSEINLRTTPPAVILLAGLQGAGKTTTGAKLAKWLQEKQKKSILMVSADIYRPAAIQQLEILAKQIDVHFFASHAAQKPTDIVTAAIDHAKRQSLDIVLVDTAGRLTVDADMMEEIKAIHAVSHPIETLFIVDSMTGQDAANTAKAFNDALPLTGVILTKADGDARGGAALSIRQITGKPIKFIGVGEKLDALEPFYPDRMASRVLGMGDLLGLIQQTVDDTKAQNLRKKIQTGRGFSLTDFADQLRQMEKMGGMEEILKKLPGMPKVSPQALKQSINNNINKKNLAIIGSMTPQERLYPDLLKASRKIRIAKGSGTQVQDINQLLKQFDQMQKVSKKLMGKGSMKNMMRNFPGF
jgi:signal recognition particle subunit SRP54